MDKYNKYFTVFAISCVHTLKNYKSLIGLSLFLMTCLLIFAHLWKFAAARAGIVNLNPEQLLWYIAFNEWVITSIPHIHDDMEEDLHSGRLAYLLPRPISYLGSTFCESLGVLCVNLIVLGLVTFLFTYSQANSLPFPPLGLLVAIPFAFLAGCLGIIFNMLVGFSAFWLNDVDPFYWVWEKCLFMFGGLMLPLEVYPQVMQTIASLTPFPAILGGRSALALDFNFQSVLVLLFSYTGWGLFGIICLNFVYRKGLRILNVEGG